MHLNNFGLALPDWAAGTVELQVRKTLAQKSGQLQPVI